MNTRSITNLFYAFLLCILLDPLVWAAPTGYMLPTAIPSEPAQQIALRKTLISKTPGLRIEDDWKKVALLYVSNAADAPPADITTLREAEDWILAARAVYPKDAELMALEGSVTCMKARNPKIDGTLAMTYARQGFRQLDKAVMSDPQSLGARLQRGITLLRVPRFLGKTELAENDLEFVLDQLPARSDGRTLELRAMLYYLLGDALTAAGQPARARQLWQQAAALQAPVWSSKARAKLPS